MHWACGGDIFLKRSFDSGRTWHKPKVGRVGVVRMQAVGRGHQAFPDRTLYSFSLPHQVVYSFDEEGGIAKMIANKLMVNSKGQLLLPFWREMGGQPECNQRAALHGMPGLLISNDKVSFLYEGAIHGHKYRLLLLILQELMM